MNEWRGGTDRTAIPEISEKEVIKGQTRGKAAVLFMTALCGTCMLAEKMLGVAQAAGTGVPAYRLNINYAPTLRDEWRIASVPCLVLLQDGLPAGRYYALHDVGHVYQLLTSFREGK